MAQETETETEAALFESLSGDEPQAIDIIADKSPAHYQYKGRYIMTAVKSGLMIIDQHRAHVRILYEKYLRQQDGHKRSSQKVLFPEVVHLTVSDTVMLDKITEEMTGMGFELTALGGGSYAVNAVPAGIDGINVVSLVKDMVASAAGKDTSAADEINRSLALSLARNAAIPQGQVLGNDEMEEIVNSLFACNNVNYTPDGKMVLAILRQQEIEHLLG